MSVGSNDFKQLDPETDSLLIALAEAETMPNKIDQLIGDWNERTESAKTFINAKASTASDIIHTTKVKVSKTYDEATEYVKNVPPRIAASAAEATEYVKAVPGRIAATADEASEYTKELLGNAVQKVRKAFIGKKEEAPAFLQDNEYIKSGYRIEHNSCCLAAKSLFTCHNESVNVWSHLFGAVLFLAFLFGLGFTIIPRRFEVGR